METTGALSASPFIALPPLVQKTCDNRQVAMSHPRCESCPAKHPPEKAWFRLVIALLCAASFVVSAALLDEEVTSVRRARG